MKRRVVITGVGLLTPVANGTAETFNALLEGKSGAGYITYFDATDFPVKIAAEIKNLNPEEYVDKRDIKVYDRFVIFG
ncbi:MAG: beta-ketoacyl-[acyl-carrier-protein] synthase II, partial [Deferribacterales bacterium]